MAWKLPTFTKAQRRELAALGLSESQIGELERVLIKIREDLSKVPANNEVAAALDEINELASKLSRRLLALNVGDAAKRKAGDLIANGYWPRHHRDDGPTLAHHLCPRLNSLAEASKAARANVPRGSPARTRTATVSPIERIDEAIVWGQRDGSELPPELRPSASPGSKFRKITGICYEAALGDGQQHDPERAIKAYLKIWKARFSTP